MKHNDDLENVRTTIPGPRSADLWPLLQEYESRNVTFVSNRFPVAWESASGATVVDRDGNRYIDLTAAFGVANVGHANPHVIAAITEQAQKLPHGMGDIHPNDTKALLLRRIAHIAPRGLTKTFLATTGSEAVEAALKTAMLATGKHAFAAYRGAYHGLSFGTLAISGIEKFRHPFVNAIADSTLFLNFPHATHRGDQHEVLQEALTETRRSLDTRDDLAALIIEPIQGRGGIVVPPHGYLAGLRKLCSERGILLIFDEIFTGFGRTGKLFDCFYENVAPDILCLGKAMGGGMPISAAVATPKIMDVWPHSTGEALHTSTYLGHPIACAAALATIDELDREKLSERSAQLGLVLGQRLTEMRERLAGTHAHNILRDVRGRGLMWGLQLRDPETAERVVADALARGVLLLQAGATGDVISLTPPLVISERQLNRALDIIEGCISERRF